MLEKRELKRIGGAERVIVKDERGEIYKSWIPTLEEKQKILKNKANEVK